MDLLGRVGRAASIAIPLAVGIAAFALRLRTALADFETYDERTWAMLSDAFGFEASALDVAQVMMALVVSVLLGVIVWLLTQWVGRGAHLRP